MEEEVRKLTIKRVKLDNLVDKEKKNIAKWESIKRKLTNVCTVQLERETVS